MTDSDSELEEIRRKKLQELQERDGTAGDASTGSTDSPSATPDDPVPLEATDGLEAFVASHDVVLVDFHAEWCGPCQQLEPVVAEVAAGTDAAVLKVDIDANPGLAGDRNVRGVPTLLLFADGEPVERLSGYQNQRRLQSLIERYTSDDG